MADKKQEKTKEKAADAAAEGKIGMVTWLVMGVVVLALSGSGFVLGRLIAGAPDAKPAPDAAAAEAPTDAAPDKTPPAGADGKTAQPPLAGEDSWYYNSLDSVVVNPDEPGATRFVRVGLILEMDAALTADKAALLIPKKQPLLINWLNLYFKGLSLDQMADEKDMNRILAQITDSFNEILFPDAKPMIKRTLIREFNIQ